MRTQSDKGRYLRPLNKYRQADTPEDYLNQRLSKTEGCWLWEASVDKDGYGQCHAAKTAKELGVTRAHQMSYKTWVGDIPDGYFVCHKCDNPTCCNPEHLFLGTAQDNNDDMWSKGRWRSGAKAKFDRGYILSQYGLKSSKVLSEELGCSYSLVCAIWRSEGLKGKNWHKGVRVGNLRE